MLVFITLIVFITSEVHLKVFSWMIHASKVLNVLCQSLIWIKDLS